MSEKNYKKVSIIVSTISSLYKKISIVILVIGLLLNFTIPFFIEDDILTKEIYVLNTSLTYSYAKYSILFTANQEFGFVRLVQGISKILVQLLQIFVIIKYNSIIGFILLLVLENFILYILYRIYYVKKYSNIKVVKEREKGIAKNLLKLFWHKIGGLIVFNTDYLLISKFISLSMVGIYSSYLMVVNAIGMFIGIAVNVLSPRVGKFISENSIQKNFDLWKKMNIIFIFLGVLLTYVTYKMINSFILLWLGSEYLFSSGTVLLIVINLFIISTRVITEMFKNGYGFFNDIHLPILEAAINLVFSIVLIKYIGINGVIIGTIISNVTIILLARPILVFKVLFKKNYKEYLYILLEYIILIALVICISEIIINKIVVFKEILTWRKWIEASIKISLISVLISTVIFLFNRDFRENLKYLKKS